MALGVVIINSAHSGCSVLYRHPVKRAKIGDFIILYKVERATRP